jgi:hypothetical protein
MTTDILKKKYVAFVKGHLFSKTENNDIVTKSILFYDFSFCMGVKLSLSP